MMSMKLIVQIRTQIATIHMSHLLDVAEFRWQASNIDTDDKIQKQMRGRYEKLISVGTFIGDVGFWFFKLALVQYWLYITFYDKSRYSFND